MGELGLATLVMVLDLQVSGGFIQHEGEHIHSNDKEIGRKGVSLPKSPLTLEVSVHSTVIADGEVRCTDARTKLTHQKWREMQTLEAVE